MKWARVACYTLKLLDFFRQPLELLAVIVSLPIVNLHEEKPDAVLNAAIQYIQYGSTVVQIWVTVCVSNCGESF